MLKDSLRRVTGHPPFPMSSGSRPDRPFALVMVSDRNSYHSFDTKMADDGRDGGKMADEGLRKRFEASNVRTYRGLRLRSNENI